MARKKLVVGRPVLIGSETLDRALRNRLFGSRGIAGKLLVTLIAVANEQRRATGDFSATGRSSQLVTSSWTELIPLVIGRRSDYADPVRDLQRAAQRLDVLALLARESGAPAPTWRVDRYPSRDGFMVPTGLWNNGWLTQLTGHALALYLVLLRDFTAKHPGHERRPRETHPAKLTTLMGISGLSAPSVRVASGELEVDGLIERSMVAGRGFVRLVNPELTDRPPP